MATTGCPAAPGSTGSSAAMATTSSMAAQPPTPCTARPATTPTTSTAAATWCTRSVAAGIDTVWSSLANYILTADVENLHYNGVGSFTGIGNGLANTIAGPSGNDRLEGGGGDDL